MGRPAVCGVGAITIAADGRSATVAGVELAEGTRISLDGHRGIVSAGERPFAPAGQDPYLERLLGWFRDGLAVPVLSQSAAGDAGVLLLDDPQLLSAKQANQRLAELNGAGTHPPIFVSARWATAADRVLEGSSAGIGCIGDVVAWPVVARGLRAG
jgi:hypothetical protein